MFETRVSGAGGRVEGKAVVGAVGMVRRYVPYMLNSRVCVYYGRYMEYLHREGLKVLPYSLLHWSQSCGARVWNRYGQGVRNQWCVWSVLCFFFGCVHHRGVGSVGGGASAVGSRWRLGPEPARCGDSGPSMRAHSTF